MDRPSASAPLRSPLHTVAVVGLGTMGTGIAEVLVRAGHEVVGIDISERRGRRGRRRPGSAPPRAPWTASGSPPQERAEALARFRTFTDLRAAADADLVIEVVPESYELKQRGLRRARLDRRARHAILATGTNALSVTRLAAETARPSACWACTSSTRRQAMKLVEVVSTVLTAPEADAARSPALVRDLGKEPVPVGDRPGFVADGLLFGYLNQAAAMYEARYATREDIDAAMRLGCGLPMGPLALLDLIGIDTARTVLEAMYAASHDRLHAPAPILGQLAAAGLTGRKSGRGFYTYEAPGRPERRAGRADPRPRRRPAPAAARCARSGVAGSGTMATGIAEVFAKAGLPRGAGRPQPGEGRGRGGPDRQVAGALGRQGPADRRADRDAALARITPAGLAGRLRRGGPGGRGGRRGPGGQAAAVRDASTRSASRARCSPPPPPRCRWSRSPRATSRPAGRDRACTSSTRRRR